MKKSLQSQNSLFKGGTMGDFTRTFDWSGNSLGTVDTWPSSLLTTLNILFNAKFPMLLFWGPDHICFYNDAYQPHIRKTRKHPVLLGQPGSLVWPDTWSEIQSVIDQIHSGKDHVGINDALIPFSCNEKENGYWIGRCSPVYGGKGDIDGVLISGIEEIDNGKKTTRQEKVVSEQTKYKSREDQLSQALDLSGLAIFEWYFKSDKILWSPEMFRLWGYEVGEIEVTTKHLLETTYSDDVPLLQSALEQMRSGKEIEIAYRRLNKEGKIIFISSKVRMIYDNSGNPIGVFGIELDITPLKDKENQLIEINQELKTTEQICKIGSWKINFSKSTYEWSDEMFALFGFQPGEISLDTKTHGNVHPDDLTIINNALNQIKESGQPVEFEIRRLSKEGQIVHALSKGRPDALVDGKVIGVRGITMNVTAFKEKENALFESERLNKSILDIVPNIIYIYDLEKDNYFFINRGVYRFLGYNESDNSMESQPHFKLIHPDDHDKVQEHLSNCRDMNDHQVLEVEYRCQSGEKGYKYLLSRDTVYQRNNDGIVMQILGVLCDVTEIEQTSRNLESMNQLLSSKNRVLEQQLLTEFAESFASYETGEAFFHALSKELAYKTQLDYVAFGRLTDDNLSINTFSFRYRGNLIDNIIYPLADSPCEQVIKNNLYTFPDTCHIAFPNNDAIKDLHIEGYIGYPIFDYQRNVVGLINIMHKNPIENVKYVKSLLQVVSKRVEIEWMRIENEKEMRKTNMRLERQNYDLTSFNHAVSHDLQEPLRKIRMFISRMNDEGEQSFLPDRFRYYHARIEDAVIRMQTLIKDLLVFSSINEKASLFDQTDLTEIVQDCVQELTDQIQEKKAIIEVEDLPVVLGVPFQLRQLVINILDNALKYTREGIRPKIKITSKILDKGDPVLSKLPNSHDQYLKISFSDNGIGLDKNYAESIFNPFKRLHMKDEYPGSGIGLAICKKIVETHQGLITADGRKGFGSTFRVYLPILSEATFSCR